MAIDTASLAATLTGVAAILAAIVVVLQRVSALLSANTDTGQRHDADVAALRETCYRDGYGAGYADAARNLGASDLTAPRVPVPSETAGHST